MSRVLLFSLVFIWAGAAFAVPSFLHMFKRCYNLKTASCMACHAEGAGGKLGDYGKDFMKAGGDWNAFTAIENKDSDGDRASNLQEISAGSNPGHPASTPKRPGKWLANLRIEDQLPLDELKEFFPQFKRFEYQDVALSEKVQRAVADALGTPLATEDLMTTFYFPIDEKSDPPVRAGVAVYTATSLNEGLLLSGLALAPSGRVIKAWAQLHTTLGRDSLKKLAKQIVGKTSESPLRIGQDLKPIKGRRELSRKAAREFKKNLLIISHVLSTGP